MKNVKKLYRNQGFRKKDGIVLFLDSFNFVPSNWNNCPRPQKRLQYVLFPVLIESIKGTQKQISPNHANIILNIPSIKYKADVIHK